MQQHKIKESWGYYILIQGFTILHGELHGDVYQDPKFLCFQETLFPLQQQSIRIKYQITICSTLTGQMWWQIIYLWARMCWQFIQSRGFWDFTNAMFCKNLQMPTMWPELADFDLIVKRVSNCYPQNRASCLSSMSLGWWRTFRSELLRSLR